MIVPSITMTLLYIRVGLVGNFSLSLWWLFSSEHLMDIIFTRNPSSSHTCTLTPIWAGPFSNSYRGRSAPRSRRPWTTSTSSWWVSWSSWRCCLHSLHRTTTARPRRQAQGRGPRRHNRHLGLLRVHSIWVWEGARMRPSTCVASALAAAASNLPTKINRRPVCNIPDVLLT
jgi:hypothetical protein